MATGDLKLYLTFPAGAKTNYSQYLIQDSLEIRRRLMNDECRSTTDTCSFELKYNSALQAALFSATDWIVFNLDDSSDTALFTGVIAPTFGLRKTTNVRPIRVEAVDNSYLLDEPINTSFNYPATIGGTAYQIFNADDSSNNVIWELLEDAGYTPATDIAATAPDLTTTVEYFQGTADEETYREYIDDLLSEYGHVFYFDASGKFTIYEWDKDTVTSTADIDEDIEIKKMNWSYDGVEVEAAQTDTLTDALLYRASLPISQTNGEWGFTGEAIANNDYWPPDGDIDDIWQNYTVKWLDEEWLARETRLKNKDLALIAADASDSTVDDVKDAGVSIYSSTYEAKRAKVLYQNTSGATAKIYNFEIHGTALFRKYRRYVKCPNTTTRPKKVLARFIYDDELATVQTNAYRYARALDRWRTYGNYKYEWTDRTDRAIGTIVTIKMTHPSIDQTVMVTEKRWNPQRTTYDYVARGISAYVATTVADRGEMGVPTQTSDQILMDAAQSGVLTNSEAVIGMTSVATPVSRARRLYLGHMSGDKGAGLYFKEYNGTSWETRGYMRTRDPSTWLVVDSMSFAVAVDNVGLS